MVWNFVVHMFTTWLPWAQNWMVSLSAVDWQNYTQIMYDQWIVDVVGTGLEPIIIWQFVEAVGSTFGATIGIFTWWFIAHICWPWLSFLIMGLFIPAGALAVYLIYLIVIYVLLPVLFIMTIKDLLKGKWMHKAFYLILWATYTYLLFTQTPEVILIHPGWYVFTTILFAIGFRNYTPSTKTSS